MSTTFVYSNNVNTELAVAITTTTQTTVTLQSTANLPTIPSGDIWVLTLNDAATGNVYEILYVTARTGAVLTVLRGQEGTAATTWAVNDLAYAPGVTVATLNNFALINGSSTQNFAVAALSMTGALTGATSGAFTGAVSLPLVTLPNFTIAGSAGTVYLGNDNGATGGLLFNVPTGSTNGYSFDVNNVTALRITNTGAIISNTSGAFQSTTVALTLGVASTAMTECIKVFSATGITDFGWNGASTTSGIASTLFGMDNSSTNMVSFDATGNFGIAGTEGSKASGTAWQNLSDARIKENIQDYEKGLDGILALRPVTFDFNGKAGRVKGPSEHAGYIAQEVQAAHPEMVRLRSHIDERNPEASMEEVLCLDTSDITPMLVNSVKQMAAKLAAAGVKGF